MLPSPSIDPGTAILMVLVSSAAVVLLGAATGVSRGLKENLYRWLTGRDWRD